MTPQPQRKHYGVLMWRRKYAPFQRAETLAESVDALIEWSAQILRRERISFRGSWVLAQGAPECAAGVRATAAAQMYADERYRRENDDWR